MIHDITNCSIFVYHLHGVLKGDGTQNKPCLCAHSNIISHGSKKMLPIMAETEPKGELHDPFAPKTGNKNVYCALRQYSSK